MAGYDEAILVEKMGEEEDDSSNNTEVTNEDISELIGHFARETFKCSSSSDFVSTSRVCVTHSSVDKMDGRDFYRGVKLFLFVKCRYTPERRTLLNRRVGHYVDFIADCRARS